MINLENGYIAPAAKEFITTATTEAISAVQANAPMNEKEVWFENYQDIFIINLSFI